MKFLRCLFIFISIHFSVYAQLNYDPGYIVAQTQDTIRGVIDVAMESDLSGIVKFRREGSTEWKSYMPGDIRGFGLGRDIYKSMRFQNTAEDSVMVTAFVKLLVHGEYNLYSYLKADRRFYLLQNDSIIYFLYDGVTRISGETDQKGNYLNYLSLVSVPCENISNQYDRVSYNDKAMSEFILKVDNCISPGKNTNLYKKPTTVIQPFVFAGGFPVPDKTQITAFFNLRFTLPRLDNKSSFNIGIHYSSTTVETSERTPYYNLYTLITHNQILSLPVSLQFNFTTTRVQPYFYAGCSGAYLMKTTNSVTVGIPTSENKFGLALVAGIGVQAKITSRFFVQADWRYELLLQYPAIGIAYQF